MASIEAVQENLREFAEKTWPDNPRFKRRSESMSAQNEVILEDGKVIGSIKVFRAPEFTGRNKNYVAIRPCGEVVGCAQPTKAAAILLLKSL